MVTFEEYAKLSAAQQKAIKRDELNKLIDNQLALMNNDPNAIRNVITNTINAAIDKKFEQLAIELKQENDVLKTDNQVMRKVLMEQQKSLERIHKDRTRKNVFITGIPNTMEADYGDDEVDDPRLITNKILKYVLPDISKNDYKIMKSFEPREGNTSHAAKLSIYKEEVKKSLMKNKAKLKTLEETDTLRKVFIKNEETPLARKENDGVYTKMKELKENNPEKAKDVRITKGKLLKSPSMI